MHESMMQEIARQHIQDLHREASMARLAEFAKAQKKDRGKPPGPLRARPKTGRLGERPEQDRKAMAGW